MSDFHEYDPELVDVIFAFGPIDGWSEDEMISIEPSGPIFTLKVGVKGDVSRSKDMSVTCAVAFKLMNTSKSNAFLSAIAIKDRKSTGGAGVGPILVRDRNGVSLFSCDKSWIEKLPTITKGKEAAPQEWVIRTSTDFEFFESGT